MRSEPGERPRRRTVRRLVARAGLWTLITAILLLALIGFLHLTRGTAMRHVRGINVDGIPAVSELRFPLSVTLHTATSLGRILLDRAAAGVRVFVLYDGR